jgi:uncharacterized protein YggE
MMPILAVTHKRVRSGRAFALALLYALALSALAPPRARAQPGDGASQNLEGIAVAGKGQVSIKPDLVEIDVDISAASELTADAIVKYRDAKRRLRDAFSALKLTNVGVDERGLAVEQKGMNQSPYFFYDAPSPRAKTEVQLSRKLIVKATDVRKMDEEAVLQLVAKLIDVAQDAGAHVGPQQSNNYYSYRFGNNSSGLVRFVVNDIENVEEEAYEKAIADARKRAERLARLSKVELGPIVAVREIVVPGESQGTTQGGFNPYFGIYESGNSDDDEGKKKRLQTSKYQPLQVHVELMVRFSVRPRSDARPSAAEAAK